MSIEVSQGKRRPRVPRAGENADVAATVLAGPYKDPATGRFLPGNSAARLRGLKRAPKLTTLNPERCADWARPFIELAHTDASELAAEVGAERSPSLLAFAEDAATAGAMHRACMAIALSPETDKSTRTAALNEARMWLRERRQSLLSLRGEARTPLPERRAGGESLADLLFGTPEDSAGAHATSPAGGRSEGESVESASEHDEASEGGTGAGTEDDEGDDGT